MIQPEYVHTSIRCSTETHFTLQGNRVYTIRFATQYTRDAIDGDRQSMTLVQQYDYASLYHL